MEAGGAERQLVNPASGLCRRGHDMLVVFFANRYWPEPAFRTTHLWHYGSFGSEVRAQESIQRQADRRQLTRGEPHVARTAAEKHRVSDQTLCVWRKQCANMVLAGE
jgi:hypothetical protein